MMPRTQEMWWREPYFSILYTALVTIIPEWFHKLIVLTWTLLASEFCWKTKNYLPVENQYKDGSHTLG